MFHRLLVEALLPLGEPYEIIAVDNGSQDGTRQKLTKLSPISAVLLSRNFGKNAAFDAGLNMAIGDFIITLEEDAVIHPEDLSKIIKKLKEGSGAVIGWRKNLQRPFFGRALSALANILVVRVTGMPLHDFRCPLKGYRREFIDGLRLFGDTFMFVPVFAYDRGAKVSEVEIDIKHDANARDYGLGEIVRVCFALISVKFILNYFARPLRFFGNWSIFFAALAFFAFFSSIILKIIESTVVSPALLPIIGVMFAILSVILFMMGFLAEILLRIYYENKDNSPYMIYEVVKNK